MHRTHVMPPAIHTANSNGSARLVGTSTSRAFPHNSGTAQNATCITSTHAPRTAAAARAATPPNHRPAPLSQTPFASLRLLTHMHRKHVMPPAIHMANSSGGAHLNNTSTSRKLQHNNGALI